MIRNIIFDFGAVLVDWNPKRLYLPYFNDEAQTDYFLSEICPFEWNAQADAGRTTAEITDERAAQFPEWEKEIRMYFDHWHDMIGGAIPGMYELVSELKAQGYRLYGLTNWSRETFPLIRHEFPVFDLLDGIVVSGVEHQAKPGPEIYQTLIERYSLDPQESVFIDDNPANIQTGEALGIRGIIFRDCSSLKEELSKLLRKD